MAWKHSTPGRATKYFLRPYAFSGRERACLIFVMLGLAVVDVVLWAFRFSDWNIHNEIVERADGGQIAMTIIEALLSITLLFSIRFLWLDLFPISRLLFQNLVFGLYWTVVFAVGMAGGWYAEICIGGAIMGICDLGLVYSGYKLYIFRQDQKWRREVMEQSKSSGNAVEPEEGPTELEPVHLREDFGEEDSVVTAPPPYTAR
ncbi:hypothetical protein B9Z65_2658 [Elsinoe australis]|uniref:MARVEL domain-containing protein n=1 Tax=Elsinoe australis TaxID=40998 RepID=A0A2P8A488_9PEZI|nr:hypothetical protein B9Z65_2658 [Elsinoe australis]